MIRALAATLVVAAVVTTDAQVRVVRHDDDRLAGISTLDVLVRELRGAADACGVSRSALQEVAVATLRASGLKASVSGTASSWFYTVQIAAESASDGDRCVTALNAELIAQVEGIPEADRHAAPAAWGSLLVGEMPLVRHSALISSSRSDHAARVTATMRDRVTDIGAKIRVVNQTR